MKNDIKQVIMNMHKTRTNDFSMIISKSNVEIMIDHCKSKEKTSEES